MSRMIMIMSCAHLLFLHFYPQTRSPAGSVAAKIAFLIHPVRQMFITCLVSPCYKPSQHVSPSNASMPSFPIIGTMIKAATGSAHHHPDRAFSTSPPSRIADRYTQNSVCCASAAIAALFNSLATRRLARVSNGMTIKDAMARTIPMRLRSGVTPWKRASTASYPTSPASRRKQIPTIRKAIVSSRSRCASSRCPAL